VDSVARAIGPDSAFAEELHHIGEHSVELAAIWLPSRPRSRTDPAGAHLCGSFQHFYQASVEPGADPMLTRALDALNRALDGRTALIVAAGDLAHIGPAFGDPMPVDFAGRARLAAPTTRSLRPSVAATPQRSIDRLRTRTTGATSAAWLPFT